MPDYMPVLLLSCRHVNRLAMAAKVPLVESGTAGYVGQVRLQLQFHYTCTLVLYSWQAT
jgi:molybdopterin/thiamine biosynthesis adenylyltransferase